MTIVQSAEFEQHFLAALKEKVGGMPPGSAKLDIGTEPGSRTFFPYFRITPSNPAQPA